jgi:hypothetical protein
MAGRAYAFRVTDARRALLGELIDHAPLFPPAELPLDEALEDHRRARGSAQSWVVRRFVVPASQLGDLDGEPLRLSVVADEPLGDRDDRIEALEGRDPALAKLGYETYLEDVPLSEVASVGAAAKIRCSPAPTVEELAGFVRACRETGVSFKATAGLHHAVRTNDEHGFLNLLAAAVFGDEEAALAESDDEAFSLDGESFGWRDRRAGVAELSSARKFFSGIGSCSFTEPVEELERLEML